MKRKGPIIRKPGFRDERKEGVFPGKLRLTLPRSHVALQADGRLILPETNYPTSRLFAPLSPHRDLRILLFTALIALTITAWAEIPSTPAPAPSFGMAQSRLWLAQSQVVAFSLPAPVKEKLVLPTRIEPATAAEILQPATVLKGEKIGFVRVRSLQKGKAVLHAGDAVLPVDIVPDPAAEVLAPRPDIISPVPGACIYGTITAGVELTLPDLRKEPDEPRLILPGGQELTPRAQTVDVAGSTRVFVYEVNADELPPGPAELQAYFKDAQGRRVMAEGVKVTVVRPDASLMISGACADRVTDPRPLRFGEKTPAVSKPKEGVAPFVTNYGADPAWCLRETIEKPGWYQLTMRVRGDAAQGSYPSIGVILNEDDRSTVSARLVDKDWHRIPVGKPVKLAAGEQFVTARFLNDFGQGKLADRNLFLDRYEFLRVGNAEGAEPAESDASMMSEGGAAMMVSSEATMVSGNTAMSATPGDVMMPAGAPMMSGDAMMAMGDAPDSGDLRVSFDRVIDGRLAQGPLTLRATTWRTEKTPAPDVDLVLNGAVFASQQGSEVAFRVPTEALRAGENSVRLRARSARGEIAISPVETIVQESRDTPTRPAPRYFRHTVESRAWDPGLAQRLEKDKPMKATFFANGEAILSLPPELEGEFNIRIDAKGQDFQGPPVVEASVKVGDEPSQKIGEAPVVGGFKGFHLGTAKFKLGPKQIVLRYANDLAEEGKGDRNWWLRSLILEEKVKNTDTAPSLQIVYPRLLTAPLDVYGATVIVAKVFSPDGIEWCDLQIDGVPQNLRLSSEDGLGRVVLPIVASSLKPGDHPVRVVVRSKNGKETTSESLTLRVVDQPVRADNTYARAVFLLNRFGFGPEPEELADVLLMGEKKWLSDRLAQSWDTPGEQAAFQRSWNENRDPLNKGQVVTRTLSYLLRSPNPVRCRFVLWTENHFSTWLEKAELSKWGEHERFLQLGVAPFGDLLIASATSPAMLLYLDQARSFAKKLNENYAREVMELHTVGVHGGYRQEDVTNLASILTGWSLSSDAPIRLGGRDLARNFRYDPSLSAPEGKRVFGMEFPKADDPKSRYDRTRSSLEMLAGHPSTALYISRKLAEHYVAVPAPESLVKRLATRFRETGGAMDEVLLTLADSPEFWAALGQPKIATPLDFSLRLSRIAGATNAGAVNDFLRKSGTGLFDRATPDGYPEDDGSYASSNALLQRWRFTQSLTGQLRRLLPPTMLPTGDEPWPVAAQERAVDFYASRLFGQPLPVASRQAAAQYLSAAQDPDRVKLVAAFVSQLPPASLR